MRQPAGVPVAARRTRLDVGGSRAAGTLGVLAAVAVCVGAGYLLGAQVAPIARDRMLPWIIGRATGVGAFLALTAMEVIGLQCGRRAGRRVAHPETLLRVHAAVAAATVALVAAHVGSLLSDRYAGVVVSALVVPGAAHYRPAAVALGTVALEGLVVITLSAALAGRPLVRSRWAVAHSLALPTFVLTFAHGVLAGTDTRALRLVYVASAVAVAGSLLLRLLPAGAGEGAR